MVKATNEKEAVVEKLKSDLEVKQRQLEEEKAANERSDPESVMSSLTEESTGSSRESSHHKSSSHGSIEEKKRKASPSDDEDDDRCKEKKHRVSSSEAATEDSSGEGRESRSGGTRSDTESGSGNGSGSANKPNAKQFSTDKAISTVSDLTKSNRISSDSGECDDTNDIRQPSTSSISSDAAVASVKPDHEAQSGHRDVVFNNDRRSGRKRPPEEVTSLERNFKLDYKEVFDKSNIPQLIAMTSGKIVTWNDCFVKASGYRKSELDRMTIFSLVRPDKLSNFFEIVAAALRSDDEANKNKEDQENTVESKGEETPSAGVKVKMEDIEDSNEDQDDDERDTTNANTENDSEDTDLVDPKEEEKSTKDDKSSNERLEATSSKTGRDETASGEDDLVQKSAPERQLDYKAITLPCIAFPALNNRNLLADNDTPIDPLNVTVSFVDFFCFHIFHAPFRARFCSPSICFYFLVVKITLMNDKDPRKRCFHCVFTNCPGTNGALGSITPDLLASLFAGPIRRKKHHHRRRRNNHKRARISVVETRTQSASTSSNNENYSASTSTNVVSSSASNEKTEEPLVPGCGNEKKREG